MNNLKNDKGVTLIALTITIIVLLIISEITITSSRTQLAIKKLNNLYSDIEAISTKVSDYYIKNNSLPIFEDNPYMNDSTSFGTFISSKGGNQSIINTNDNGEYYVLNLSKLDNLTLNYGSDYKKWDSSSTYETYQDLYIINKVTHQIYYAQGIEYDGEKYFTKENSSKNIEKIDISAVTDDFKIQSITANKMQVGENGKVILNANVTLVLSSNYKKDTLQYMWKKKSDSEKQEYSKFEVNNTNEAILASKEIEDASDYILILKILDVNGKEHTIEQEVSFN